MKLPLLSLEYQVSLSCILEFWSPFSAKWLVTCHVLLWRHRDSPGHLGTDSVWSGNHGLEWAQCWGQAAVCLFLKASLPVGGPSPCSSSLSSILSIPLVQIPEETCLTDLSSCPLPYRAEPGPRSYCPARWLASLGSAPVAPIQRVAISTRLSLLLWYRSCYNQTGSSPVYSVPGVVLGLMDIC